MSLSKSVIFTCCLLSFIGFQQELLAQEKKNFQGNQVTGHEAFVSGGRANRAFGAESFIGGGYKNTTDGELSIVVGGQFNTTRNSFATIGGGYVNEVKGQYATIPGGWWLKAPSFGEFSVGYLNTIYSPMSAVSPHPKDRLFTVGNGRTEVISAIETVQNRSDAFYILKGGDAMLSGRLYQAADTINYVSKDSLSSGSTDFSGLDVLQFKWEGESGFRNRYDLNYGLNGAQVKKNFPNLVSKDGLGYITVDYIGFVPLLIEDSKQKDEEIEVLQKELAKQQNLMDQVNRQMLEYELLLFEMKKEIDLLKEKSKSAEPQESEGSNDLPEENN
jgi:uncharacterized coiled-coil protein SlyX